jgi:hypothetical protein
MRASRQGRATAEARDFLICCIGRIRALRAVVLLALVGLFVAVAASAIASATRPSTTPTTARFMIAAVGEFVDLTTSWCDSLERDGVPRLRLRRAQPTDRGSANRRCDADATAAGCVRDVVVDPVPRRRRRLPASCAAATLAASTPRSAIRAAYSRPVPSLRSVRTVTTTPWPRA